MSEAKPRALVLAERIHPQTDWYEFDSQSWCNEAAAELRRQHEAIVALSEALNALVDRNFTFFSGGMIGADRKITKDEVWNARATLTKHGVKQ